MGGKSKDCIGIVRLKKTFNLARTRNKKPLNLVGTEEENLSLF